MYRILSENPKVGFPCKRGLKHEMSSHSDKYHSYKISFQKSTGCYIV